MKYGTGFFPGNSAATGELLYVSVRVQGKLEVLGKYNQCELKLSPKLKLNLFIREW